MLGSAGRGAGDSGQPRAGGDQRVDTHRGQEGDRHQHQLQVTCDWSAVSIRVSILSCDCPAVSILTCDWSAVSILSCDWLLQLRPPAAGHDCAGRDWADQCLHHQEAAGVRRPGQPRGGQVICDKSFRLCGFLFPFHCPSSIVILLPLDASYNFSPHFQIRVGGGWKLPDSDNARCG